MQNIPIHSKTGRYIREAFIVSQNYAELMTADYSQIEMRIMVHLSQDRSLIQALNSGEDLHLFVASQYFDLPISEITSNLRKHIKTISYGLAYGLSTYSLANQLKISNEEAEEHINQYFCRFRGIHSYLHEVVNKARKNGYTTTIFGRRRFLSELGSNNKTLREAAERVALNSPIQGSAADIIKVAMININSSIKQNRLKSRMLLQVHDELLFEVFNDERDKLTQLVKSSMCNIYRLNVPLEVTVGYGCNWNSAAH